MSKNTTAAQFGPDLPARFRALVEGRLATPFSVLGIHPLAAASEPGRVIRAFLPWAERVEVLRGDGTTTEMEPMVLDGAFSATFPGEVDFFQYQLRAEGIGGARVLDDPYRFGPLLSDEDLKRVHQPDGRAHHILGAHPCIHEGVEGVRFAVWAPGALRVSVVGDFNDWDFRIHPMRPRGESGVWELFLPDASVGERYKFDLLTRQGPRILKADPYARSSELRPATASIVTQPTPFVWTDAEWLSKREAHQSVTSPVSVYEVHTPSWRRQEGARPRDGVPGWLSYRELADDLLPYVRDLGFTHVELLPITEHPLDKSWGYQTTGYFAPSVRQGTADDLRAFVDRAHELGVGVILDWVPAHFTSDAHGLARFVGSALYEHPDPRRGIHPDWGTLIFDYGRPEVRAFLISSALYWIEEFHLDGLRIDAVASMLYRDYSRDEGAWTPNEHGGREHLEAVEFLQELNSLVHREHAGALMIAEESTAWPGVTHSVANGGLGFDLKWNMGWMHDTLEVCATNPLFRGGLYERLTFSIMYAFSERFQLPLSHDEVVHLKGSLLAKMPGPIEQKFATLRLLYGHMWMHPGKKLLFMGGELAQRQEWDFEGELPWACLDEYGHRGARAWIRALNSAYTTEPALHATDSDGRGFEWIDCHDKARTVLAFLRWSPEWRESIVVVLNFAAVSWKGYKLAVPEPGQYRLMLNSDAPQFDGSGIDIPEVLATAPGPLHGREQWIEFDLPPLAIAAFKRVAPAADE